MAREQWNPWWVAGAALGISAALLAFGRGHPKGTQGAMSLAITVIPADSVNLDCSSDQRYADIHCAFDANGNPLPGAHPLRPYVTVGHELILLSGIFEEPRVSEWLHTAQRVGSGERVTLDCKATMLGTVQHIAVRWQNGAAWGQEHNVPVAKIQACTVAH